MIGTYEKDFQKNFMDLLPQNTGKKLLSFLESWEYLDHFCFFRGRAPTTDALAPAPSTQSIAR